MKSYELAAAGLKDDDMPWFKFETEFHRGMDLDGVFNIQFAAIKFEGERRFAINSPDGLLAVFNREDSIKLAESLAETGEYIVAANYENKSWEEESGVATLLMGRDFGGEVDYVEQYTLATDEYEAVQEIHSVLEKTSDA